MSYLDAKQRELISAVKELGDHRAALGLVDVSKSTLDHWCEDPDFKLAYDEAVENGRHMLMLRAVHGLRRNLDAGKLEAVKMTLQALDPDTWNPVQRVEIDAPTHKFIGFDGKPLHEGTIDGEFEEIEETTPIPPNEEPGNS